MAQTPPPTGKKPVAKPAGNPYANIQVAPRAAPKTTLMRPAEPVSIRVAAPSMGRAMTVASPAALTLAKNLRVNPNNPTAASSVPYVEPELKKPTLGDNLVTGGLRYLIDPAIDFTAGVFPLTAPFAIPASAAAASAGENWAQQYEIGRGLRTEKDPTEVALASAFGLLPLGAGAIGKLLRKLPVEQLANFSKLLARQGIDIATAPRRVIGTGIIPEYQGFYGRPPLGEFGSKSLDKYFEFYDLEKGADIGKLFKPNTFADYVQNGLMRYDNTMVDLINSLQGRPNASVEIYRSARKGAQTAINEGDWVTPSLQYAQDLVSNRKREILQRTVRAKELFSKGTSPVELGWQPKIPNR